MIQTFSSIDKKNELFVRKGGNSFVWDMKYPGAKRINNMVLWSADFSGAKAVPYQLNDQ